MIMLTVLTFSSERSACGISADLSIEGRRENVVSKIRKREFKLMKINFFLHAVPVTYASDEEKEVKRARVCEREREGNVDEPPPKKKGSSSSSKKERATALLTNA